MVTPPMCCCLLHVHGAFPSVQQQPAGKVLLVPDLCRDHAPLGVSAQQLACRRRVGASTSVLSKSNIMTEVQLSEDSLSLQVTSTNEESTKIKQLKSGPPAPKGDEAGAGKGATHAGVSPAGIVSRLLFEATCQRA